MLGYNVIDISSYIIEYSNEIGSPVSNLKLQKLLYYSQAAMLVELGQKCFDSKIMAWEFGPVVVEAYQHYKEYGRDVIPNQEDCKVVDSYSQIRNPFELVRKTHEEDPWKNTDLNQEIECDEIRKYYEKQPEKIYGV